VARWNGINQVLQLPFPDPPETYSTSDSLYEALDIPRTATGTLPRADRHRAGLDAETLEDLGETGRSRKAPTAKPAGGGSRSRSKDAPAEGDKAERAPRTPRQRSRTRTRSGQPAGGEAVEAPAGEPTESVTSPAAAGDAPARRRRRRGGRGGGSGGSGAAASEPATD
jgi:hypothetical protein